MKKAQPENKSPPFNEQPNILNKSGLAGKSQTLPRTFEQKSADLSSFENELNQIINRGFTDTPKDISYRSYSPSRACCADTFTFTSSDNSFQPSTKYERDLELKKYSPFQLAFIERTNVPNSNNLVKDIQSPPKQIDKLNSDVIKYRIIKSSDQQQSSQSKYHLQYPYSSESSYSSSSESLFSPIRFVSPSSSPSSMQNHSSSAPAPLSSSNVQQFLESPNLKYQYTAYKPQFSKWKHKKQHSIDSNQQSQQSVNANLRDMNIIDSHNIQPIQSFQSPQLIKPNIKQQQNKPQHQKEVKFQVPISLLEKQSNSTPNKFNSPYLITQSNNSLNKNQNNNNNNNNNNSNNNSNNIQSPSSTVVTRSDASPYSQTQSLFTELSFISNNNSNLNSPDDYYSTRTNNTNNYNQNQNLYSKDKLFDQSPIVYSSSSSSSSSQPSSLFLSQSDNQSEQEQQSNKKQQKSVIFQTFNDNQEEQLNISKNKSIISNFSNSYSSAVQTPDKVVSKSIDSNLKQKEIRQNYSKSSEIKQNYSKSSELQQKQIKTTEIKQNYSKTTEIKSKDILHPQPIKKIWNQKDDDYVDNIDADYEINRMQNDKQEKKKQIQENSNEIRQKQQTNKKNGKRKSTPEILRSDEDVNIQVPSSIRSPSPSNSSDSQNESQTPVSHNQDKYEQQKYRNSRNILNNKDSKQYNERYNERYQDDYRRKYNKEEEEENDDDNENQLENSSNKEKYNNTQTTHHTNNSRYNNDNDNDNVEQESNEQEQDEQQQEQNEQEQEQNEQEQESNENNQYVAQSPQTPKTPPLDPHYLNAQLEEQVMESIRKEQEFNKTKENDDYFDKEKFKPMQINRFNIGMNMHSKYKNLQSKNNTPDKQKEQQNQQQQNQQQSPPNSQNTPKQKEQNTPISERFNHSSKQTSSLLHSKSANVPIQNQSQLYRSSSQQSEEYSQFEQQSEIYSQSQSIKSLNLSPNSQTPQNQKQKNSYQFKTQTSDIKQNKKLQTFTPQKRSTRTLELRQQHLENKKDQIREKEEQKKKIDEKFMFIDEKKESQIKRQKEKERLLEESRTQDLVALMTPPNIQRKQSGIKNIIETLNDEQNSESEQYGFIQQRSQTDRVRSRMYQSPMQLNSEDSPPKADTAPLSLNAFRSLEEDFLSQIVGTPSRKSGEG